MGDRDGETEREREGGIGMERTHSNYLGLAVSSIGNFELAMDDLSDKAQQKLLCN